MAMFSIMYPAELSRRTGATSAALQRTVACTSRTGGALRRIGNAPVTCSYLQAVLAAVGLLAGN